MSQTDPMDKFRSRIPLISGMIVLALIGLVFRLAVLTIKDSPDLANRGVIQRGMHLALELPRGEITDRNGNPLTDRASHEAIAVFPSLIPKESRTSVAITLGGILNKSPGEVLGHLEAAEPGILEANSSRAIKDAVAKANLQGVLVVRQRTRYLPSAPAAHVVGYVRSVDNTGVSGIEGKFDGILRQGKAQTLTAYVDGGRKLIPGLGMKVRGVSPEKREGLSQVTLTLDEGIQAKLEEAMASVDKGAGVVLEPRTGEVLAMVSRPSFDPSDISRYLADPGRPLVNRAISAYFPGSIFKIVTAAKALEDGEVKPDQRFFDPGYYQLTPNRRVKCSKADGHGDITFLDALSKSCNTVFVKVAVGLGSRPVTDMAKAFGFGTGTGIELTNEESGSLPDPLHTTLGDVSNMALGQNGVKVTPLQAAVMMAAIANDGILVPPRIVRSVTDGKGRAVKGCPVQGEPRQVISAATARYLRYALERAVDIGTGKGAQGVWGGAAGKTGTAQTGRRDKENKPISHAWFVGYAPRITPQYVVAIIVEDGGAGGEVGVPVFAAFMDSLRNSS